MNCLQKELRLSTERHAQGQIIQTAQMDAMGYRVVAMKDLLKKRETRMET